MDEVIEFLRAVTEAELVANRANYSEPDDKKLLQLIRAWDAMFSGGITSGLSRPSGDPPGFYDAPDQVKAAASQKARTIFAVAHYQHGKTDLYRAWLGDTQLRRRGEAIRQNLYVTKVSGELKIVARYQPCGTCHGAGKLPSGESCTGCSGAGWLHQSGTQWKTLGKLLEVRKLEEPADPYSKPAYAAIDEPS